MTLSSKEKSNSLILMTNCFPYGKGETFLETEIPILAKYFDVIHIVPLKSPKGQSRTLPPNCKIHPIGLNQEEEMHYQLKKLPFVLKQLYRIWKCELEYPETKKLFIKNIRVLIQLLNAQYRIYARMKEIFQKLNEAKFIYSYWMDNWIIALIEAKRVIRPELKIVSRVHGYDLYFERGYNGYLPFRPYFFRHLDKVFCISQHGKSYLEHKFKGLSKLEVSRLGVLPVLANKNTNNIHTNRMHIVSCASLIPLKRIHLIIKALHFIDFPISWTHLGDGPLREKLENAASQLPSNIIWKFKGHVPNTEVAQFYQEQQIDLFLNVSETEGIPVSIMEAIRFGIPVIATKVGGNPEIVGPSSGFLIDKDFHPTVLAEILTSFWEMSSDKKEEKRAEAKKVFEHKYNALINYENFCERLLEVFDIEIHSPAILINHKS